MKPDERGSGNIARFFTHNRQIGWVALAATLVWGVFGYMNMPKRKDPDIPVRIGLAIAPWPGYRLGQGRAARHPEDRAGGDRQRQGGPGGIHHAGQHVRRPGAAARQHREHGPGVPGHRAAAVADHGPARRRRSDYVDQRLWRHGVAHADRGQPAGPRAGDRVASARRAGSHRRRTRQRQVRTRHPSLLLPGGRDPRARRATAGHVRRSRAARRRRERRSPAVGRELLRSRFRDRQVRRRAACVRATVRRHPTAGV